MTLLRGTQYPRSSLFRSGLFGSGLSGSGPSGSGPGLGRGRLSALLFAALAGGFGAAVLGGAGAGCGSADPPSPFVPDAGQGGAGGGGGGDVGGGSTIDPTLGGPCTRDEQCDDGFECTFDACDQDLLLCRFTPDDSICQNENFCDGMEVCDNKLGCILGAPVTCSDGNACNINTCDEATDNCLEMARDVDGDGDPDDHCGGGDCDDLNPAVSSLQSEVCNNGADDDCDGEFDEQACAAPTNDTCLDPLEAMAPGTFAMNSAAATQHYGASCGVGMMAMDVRDVVAAVTVPAGPPLDVQLTARTPDSEVALALMGMCAQPSSEIACNGTFSHPQGGMVSKVRGRSLGDAMNPLLLPAYVYTDGGSEITFRYELLPASTKPVNETCGTAEVLPVGTPVVASVVDAVADLVMGCNGVTGELVYQFDLAQTMDVDIFASSVDGDGLPVLSLRDSDCALEEDEITCSAGSQAHVFRHSLPAGSYFVAVGATAPTDVLVTLEVSPATPLPPDEDCVFPPNLPHNTTVSVLTDPHQDDVNSGCLPGGIDAVRELVLAQPSDVLLLGRYSMGDSAAIELSLPACADASDSLVCGTAGLSPARAQKRNVPAGSYPVIAESLAGAPMEITALVRPAVPPTVVPFANTCGTVQTIPSTGGFFLGNTANAQPDFEAGCDQGGQPQNGAPDQILKLTLQANKRVVLDMQGSGYSTLLSVREGNPDCPGQELISGCAAGFMPERSFLDVDLAPGDYYILVDGYASQFGAWFLDVFVVDP